MFRDDDGTLLTIIQTSQNLSSIDVSSVIDNDPEFIPTPKVICVIEIIFVLVIAFLAIVGNVVNIVVIGSSKSLKTCQGYFLLSLATADLGIGVVAFTAVGPALSHKWSYGDASCAITAYMSEVCSRVSLITMICLSIERYIAIIHPFRYQRYVTKNKVTVVICLSWLVCIAYFAQMFLPVGLRWDFDLDKIVCSADYEENMQFYIVALAILLLPSFVIITFTSIRVHTRVLKSSRRREILFGRSSSMPMTSERLPMYFRRNIKAFKLLVIVAGVYYITWLPYTIHASLLVSTISYEDVYSFVEFLTFWLTISNSGFNVFVYFVMNPKFRTKTKVLWGNCKTSCYQWCCGSKCGETVSTKILGNVRKINSTTSIRRQYFIGIRRSNGNVVPTDVRIASASFSDVWLNNFGTIATEEHLYSLKSLKRMRSEPMRKKSVGLPKFSLRMDAREPGTQPEFVPSSAYHVVEKQSIS